MLGALFLAHHVHQLPIFIDHIMRRDFRRRVRQPVNGGRAGLHAGIVQDEHINRQATLAEIR